MSIFALRDRQLAAVNKLLTLSASDHAEDFADQWKVLVYDAECGDIIAPLLNISALRQKGVTLHLLLHTEREPVPDAPAVYFLRPTEANLKRVAEDCAKQLYRCVYLNFVTRIERPLLEKFAQDLTTAGAVSSVAKVMDQYLDVIALEQSLFTLNISNSFMAYNEPSLSEQQIRSFMTRVANGLLSTIRVLGALPIIRSASGGAAEMLAQELCNILRENLSARGPAQALFSECLLSDKPRPLLLIFDRTCDLSPPLQHTSTYQALVDDLLEHRLNRVTVEINSSGKDSGVSQKKTYDLNTQTDPFFKNYAGAPFPEAVEANQKELDEVKQREDEIKARPGIGNVMNQLMEGKSKDLSEAIEVLPELLKRKANLETHTNILQNVMKRIAAREVPTFFEMEQAIQSAGGRVVDQPAVLALLRDGTKGDLKDKARLLLLVSLTPDAVGSKASADEFDTAFRQGCAVMPQPPTKEAIDRILAAAAFSRRLQALQSPLSVGLEKQSAQSLSSFLTSAQSRASSLMAKAAAFFTKFTPHYITRVVDSLSEGRACPEDDSFCTLDPRSKAGEVIDLKGSKYSDVIVFVVGGGCYSEFYNLQDLIKSKAGANSALKSVMYGTSELMSGDSFLAQLEKLAAPKM